MRAADGKMRLANVANTEQLLRLVQSIPSRKAEPFKLNQRLQAIQVGKELTDEWDSRVVLSKV